MRSYLLFLSLFFFLCPLSPPLPIEFNSLASELSAHPLFGYYLSIIAWFLFLAVGLSFLFVKPRLKVQNLAAASACLLPALLIRFDAYSIAFPASLLWIVYICAYFLPERERGPVSILLGYAMAVQMALAGGMYVFHIHQFLTPGFGERASGWFGSPNGLYPLGLICICYFGSAANGGNTVQRTVDRVIALMSLCVVLLTFSRSAWLGLSVISVLMTWSQQKLRSLGIIFAFLLVVGAFGVRTHGSWYALSHDRSANGRIIVWEDAGRLFHDRPLLGYGYAGFARAELKRGDPRLSYVPSEAKSQFVNIAVDGGFVGVGLFLVFTIGTLRMAYLGMKAWYSRDVDSRIAKTVFYSLCGLLVAGLFDTPLFSSPDRASSSVTILLLSGLVAGITNGEGKRRDADSSMGSILADRPSLAL